MRAAHDCWIQGEAIPSNVLGPLRESVPGDDLPGRLDQDGYLFIRGVCPVSETMAARQEVFSRLHDVDEIAEPVADGISTGRSARRERVADLGRFWQSVSEGPALRNVSHGGQVRELMDCVLGESARPHDFMFLRPGVVGRATDLHYDLPFFARGSSRVHTVWMALGEIPVEDGPLVVVEGSHQFDDLIGPIRNIDYDSSNSPQVQMLASAVALVRSRRSRLLTADFEPGDAVLFTMTTLHGTLDNHSPVGRTRLSCDVRWQPAADDVDPRYCGVNPSGTTGAGYGELNGAKPLTEPWHIR